MHIDPKALFRMFDKIISNNFVWFVLWALVFFVMVYYISIPSISLLGWYEPNTISFLAETPWYVIALKDLFNLFLFFATVFLSFLVDYKILNKIRGWADACR